MKKILVAVLCVMLTGVSLSFAATGGEMFRAPLLPRAIALGGAYAGLAADVHSPLYNPAGLAHVKTTELGFIHHIGLIDSVEYLALARPMQAGGILGGNIVYRHMPDIDHAAAGDEPVGANDLLLTLSYALGFKTDPQAQADLTAGLNLKWGSSNLGQYTATVLALDAGVGWRPHGWQGVKLGLAVQNVGTPVKYAEEEDPLPLNVKLGAAYRVIESRAHQVDVALDLNVPAETDKFFAGLGAEYVLNQLLALRVGYQYQQDSLASVVTCGLGIRYALDRTVLQLDYAFKPVILSEQTFDSEHFISLTIGF